MVFNKMVKMAGNINQKTFVPLLWIFYWGDKLDHWYNDFDFDFGYNEKVRSKFRANLEKNNDNKRLTRN